MRQMQQQKLPKFSLSQQSILQNLTFQLSSQPTNKPTQCYSSCVPLSQIPLKCNFEKPAFLFCLSPTCPYSQNLLCQFLTTCKCHEEHVQCQKGTFSYVINGINNRIVEKQCVEDVIEKVNSTVDHVIDTISQMRETLIKDLESGMGRMMINTTQKRFANLVIAKNPKQQWKKLNKSTLNALWDSHRQKPRQIDFQITKLHEAIKQFQKQSQSLIKQTFDETYWIINPSKSVHGQWFEQSSIITTRMQTQNLLKFFPQQVKRVKLLFKASENDFEIKRYFQKCGNQQNTLIICKTQHDKIIGGFTPLKFSHPVSQMNSYLPDHSAHTFLFSLTNNDKFIPLHPQKSLRLNPDHSSITFGNAQLSINNHSNIQPCKSYNTKNCFYSKYQIDSKDSYRKLNGGDDHNFVTKEWEVWKVEMGKSKGVNYLDKVKGWMRW